MKRRHLKICLNPPLSRVYVSGASLRTLTFIDRITLRFDKMTNWKKPSLKPSMNPSQAYALLGMSFLEIPCSALASLKPATRALKICERLLWGIQLLSAIHETATRHSPFRWRSQDFWKWTSSTLTMTLLHNNISTTQPPPSPTMVLICDEFLNFYFQIASI